MFFYTSINDKEFKQKPVKSDITAISGNFKSVNVTLETLSNELSKGKTFCPAVFKDNKRENKSFLSQQIFGLDFDSGINETQVIDILKSYGINVNLFYNTFSHTAEKPKFRICILFRDVIQNKDERDLIQKGLMALTGEADPSTKDSARMFFGGKKCTVINGTPNLLADVLPAIHSYLTANVHRNTETQITKVFEKIVQKSERLYNYNKQSPICTIKEHYNFENACKTSKVLNDFATGTHLKYAQLRVLCTNFAYIKGGIKWVTQKMNETGTYKPEDFALLNIVKRYGYLPENIGAFDPALMNAHNTLLTIDGISREIVNVDPTQNEKKPLITVRNDFRIEINKIFNSEFLIETGVDVSKFNVIRASVGIGKTESLITQIAENILKQKNMLLAVPSHKLKNELAERIREKGLKVDVTPEPPKFTDETIHEQYTFLNKIGDTNKANQLIKNIINGKQWAPYDDKITAIAYIEKTQLAYHSQNTVITTHRRAILAPDVFRNKKHIVFDEDPFKELLPITSITRSAVSNIVKGLQLNIFEDATQTDKILRTDVASVLAYLDSLTHGVIEPRKDIIFRDFEGLKNKLGTINGGEKILDFFNGDFHLRYFDDEDKERFYSVRKHEIKTDKTVTIVSATVDPYIYKKLIPQSKFIDLGIAENKGKVIQHTKKQYSRAQMRKLDFEIEQETETTVITFQEFKPKFKNAHKEIHFGNTTGFDELKGVNVDVIGTPTQNPILVYLYAKALNIDVSINKQEKVWRSCILQGRSFPFFTFIDDQLAQLDMRLTQMELEQAIGRSRTTITEAIVNVYSNLPTPMSDIFNPPTE